MFLQRRWRSTTRTLNDTDDSTLGSSAVAGRLSGRTGEQRRLRVLMFSWEYPPHLNGGMGSHVKALAPALAHQHVDVHLVTPRFNGAARLERPRPGLIVHRVDLADWESGDIVTDVHEANSRMTAHTETLVQEQGPFDVIHVHDWLVALSGFHFKHEYRWPLVATVHATERGRCGGVVNGSVSVAIDHVEWQLCYETWRVIVTSQYMADQLANHWHVPADKIDVIPNGVDVSRYRRFVGADLSEFRRHYAADDEHIVFHIGRLVHEKGAHLLVKAVPSILEEFPRARFLIAGRGPMRDRLRKLIADLEVSERVDLLGFISNEDRDRLYQVADVAVFPSLYEPFGIVALEAMAAGVPVVASEVGGLAEVVDPHETGILHTSGEPDSLAWAVRETLRNVEQAHGWVDNALEQLRTIFSWSHVAEETVRVYDQVVEERKHVDW